MKDGFRHLHELEPGTEVRFPGSGRLARVAGVTGGRAAITRPQASESVSFETHEGDEISFTRPVSGTEPCSPTAEVQPVRRVT
jgi:hypothetical protein